MKSNLDPKLESALSYVPMLGWVAAIIFLVIEKDKDVRFNAVQSLLLTGVVWVASFVLFIVGPLVWLAGAVVHVVLAYKTYKGEKIVLPMLGNWSEQLLAKISAK
jgi:uncharacterized membrane protein